MPRARVLLIDGDPCSSIAIGAALRAADRFSVREADPARAAALVSPDAGAFIWKPPASGRLRALVGALSGPRGAAIAEGPS